MRKVLVAFKNKARHVVTTCFSPFAHNFFKPSKCASLRLGHIGFSNHTPCIGSLPVISCDEAKYITKCLVATRHTFTESSSHLLELGSLQLISKRVSLRGAILDLWLSVSNLFYRSTTTQLADWISSRSSNRQEVPSDLWLACPVCLKVQDCSKTRLTKGASWKQIVCKATHCRAARSSAKWSCICGKPWYACDIHAVVGHSAGSTHATSLCKKRKLEADHNGFDSPPDVGVSKTKRERNQNLAVLAPGALQYSQPSNIRIMPTLSPVPLEAGVGVPNNRAKRKHNPNSAPSMHKRCKRRVTESQSEVIAAINRLREARQARDPG